MSVQVCGVKIKSGEKVKGLFKVGEASTHNITMPYVIVNGLQPGPKLCILGGIHPLEYASIEGVLRVANEIEPSNLKGTLLVVPIVNTDGFHARAAFNNPIDYQNQNRVFPGEPTGTMSQRVANVLFNEFISKAEYLIDSHGGDLTEDIHKYVIIGESEERELHEKMVDMASCYDAIYVRISKTRGMTTEAIRTYGIPCIIAESGTPYPVREEDVKFHYDGIKNVMKNLEMIKGRPEKKKPKINPPMERLYAKHGGIWRQKVRVGEIVKKDATLGEVADIFGETIQTIKASFDGVANSIRTSCAVNSGDTLLWVINV